MMGIVTGNIFETPRTRPEVNESFETLLESKNLLLEKIITHGELKSPGKWYDQEKDEWVMLVQGNAILEFEDKKRIEMKKGDYQMIPAHKKHRVLETCKKPDCIWLALHGNFK